MHASLFCGVMSVKWFYKGFCLCCKALIIHQSLLTVYHLFIILQNIILFFCEKESKDLTHTKNSIQTSY